MKALIGFLICVMLLPTGVDVARAATLPLPARSEIPVAVVAPAAQDPAPLPDPAQAEPTRDDSLKMKYLDARIVMERDSVAPADSAVVAEEELPLTVVTSDDYPYGLDGKKIFNPSPQRAVWLSALFPGLGQIYNRRYWKLPIIVAGYMGLGYGLSWNDRMYQDYQRAYADIMDDDPNTKSYLDFLSPNFDESSVSQEWLSQTLKSRKDYYRRNRDLCIICCVGLYLLAMLDAYVDASLSHFDISPDISMDVAPSLIVNPGQRRPTPALNWAFTF